MDKESIDRIVASNDIVAKNILDAFDYYPGHDTEGLESITPDECFKQYLEWEGIIGFDDWTKRAVKLIYGIGFDDWIKRAIKLIYGVDLVDKAIIEELGKDKNE